jgi:DNA transformation protein
MPVSSQYLEYVLDQLSCIGPVVHKRMFGGIGFYFDGLFFGLIDDDVTYFKVDDQTRAGYLKAGAVGFDPYKDGRPSVGYFSLPITVLEDQDELRTWAREAVEAARRKSQSKARPVSRRKSSPAKKTTAARKGTAAGTESRQSRKSPAAKSPAARGATRKVEPASAGSRISRSASGKKKR